MECNRTSISSKVEKERCSRGCGSVINKLEAVGRVEAVAQAEAVGRVEAVALAMAVKEAEREEYLQFHHRSEIDSGR
jgi:predicted DNA-binding protein with PD1-like motif